MLGWDLGEITAKADQTIVQIRIWKIKGYPAFWSEYDTTIHHQQFSRDVTASKPARFLAP
jgi:hypothetical protein